MCSLLAVIYLLMFNQSHILTPLPSSHENANVNKFYPSHHLRVRVCAQSQKWNMVSITERYPVVFYCQAHVGKGMNWMKSCQPVK